MKTILKKSGVTILCCIDTNLGLKLNINKLGYKLCHGFRSAKQDDYFWVDFDVFRGSWVVL